MTIVVDLNRPQLEIHYAPGMLIVLKRTACPGRLAGWSTLPKHGPNCGCHGKREIFKTTGHVSWLQEGEEKWCLERCWIPQRRDGVASNVAQRVNKGVDSA